MMPAITDAEFEAKARQHEARQRELKAGSRAGGERRRLRSVDPPAPPAPTITAAPDQADDNSRQWGDVDGFLAESKRDEECAPPTYRDTLLPDGAVVVAALESVERGKVGAVRKGSVTVPRERWFALLRIVEGEHAGKLLLRAYNAPPPGRLSAYSELAIDWGNVTHLVPPRIPKNASPKAVLGSFLRDVQVEVRTHVVARRMDRELGKWVETPPELHYSVADRVVRVVNGCPRVLIQRRP